LLRIFRQNLLNIYSQIDYKNHRKPKMSKISQAKITGTSTKAWLLLEDGSVYQGKSLGLLDHKSTGELVFNTGMTGYQEILTDPSYAGQIITLTCPEIGNYGIREIGAEQTDSQSKKVFARGLVIKNYNNNYSSYRANLSLNQFLIKYKINGIFGIDTRAITRKIREKGCLKSLLFTSNFQVYQDQEPDFQLLQQELKNSPSFVGSNFLEEVSTKKAYDFGFSSLDSSEKKSKKKIAVLDFGLKLKMLKLLSQKNFQIRVFPAKFNLKELLNFEADGIFLSNGPGDPAACQTEIIENIKTLIKTKIPIFGVCFGYQVLAIALGAKTFKLKFGHRGSNHPVQDLQSGKIFITSQNHGFSVDPDSFSASYQKQVMLTHRSLNDQTLEGFRLKNQKLFAVQFHPEASPGPNDTDFMFKEFIDLI